MKDVRDATAKILDNMSLSGLNAKTGAFRGRRRRRPSG
jgi:hypothetical protein